MRVKVNIEVGNITLEWYAIFGDEWCASQEKWRAFIDGEIDRLESHENRPWSLNTGIVKTLYVQAEDEKALISLGCFYELKVEVPLVLFKAEMRRVLEEYNAAMAEEAEN